MEKENKSPTMLPQIKQSTSQTRFSSWNSNTSKEVSNLSELDELLLEHDELLSQDKQIVDEDCLDLENSDELNKIISKYETMLDKKPEAV